MSEAHRLDLGPSDVHVSQPGRDPDYVPTKTPTEISHITGPAAKTMSELDAAQRRKIPSSQFGDPSTKGYPLVDKAHADNAAARLEQQKGSMSPGKYASIKRRIKAAQKRFGEKPKVASAAAGRMRGSMKGLRMTTVHPDGTRIEVRHMSAADAVGVCRMPCMPITLGDD